MYSRLFREISDDLPTVSGDTRSGLQSFGAWLAAVRVDLLIGAALGLAIGAYCAFLALRIPAALIDPRLDAWVWFEADLIRVYKSFTSLGPHNWRTNVHPLQAILMYPPTKVLIKLGLPETTAVLAMIGSYAALWGGLFFSVLRGIGLRRPDSVIFTLLAASSASFVFWFPVPEVYGLGALSIALCFAIGVATDRFGLGAFWQAVGSAASLSVTTTNWMAGILLTFANNGYRRAIRITFDALLVVTLFFAVQKMMDHSTNFFVPVIWAEANYLFHELSGSLSDKARSFFLYSIAVPPIPFEENVNFPDWMRMTIQFTPVGTLGWFAVAALVIWVPLLAFGVLNGLRQPESRKIATVLMSFIAFQFLLHIFYGDETFLYSLNYAPVLVLLAGCAALGAWRLPVLAAALSLTVLAGVNNLAEFDRVTTALANHAEELVTRKPELLQK